MPPGGAPIGAAVAVEMEAGVATSSPFTDSVATTLGVMGVDGSSGLAEGTADVRIADMAVKSTLALIGAGGWGCEEVDNDAG